MQWYSYVWTIVESIGFLFAIFLFFQDPVRRWNFFGYRPTALIGLFDPVNRVVLLAKVRDTWSFSQGGIYDNNPNESAKTIIKEELGIKAHAIKLISTLPLGVLRIEDALITRSRISSISLFQKVRGKGYMAYFIRADNLQKLPKRKGSGVQEILICSVAKAKKMITIASTCEHTPEKQQMIAQMLDEVEKLCDYYAPIEEKAIAE